MRNLDRKDLQQQQQQQQQQEKEEAWNDSALK